MNKFYKVIMHPATYVIGMLAIAVVAIAAIASSWTGITIDSGDVAIMTAFYNTVALGLVFALGEFMLGYLLKDSISSIKEDR